jgi:WD40 repeat protein
VFGTSPAQTLTLLRPFLALIESTGSLVFSSPSSLISASGGGSVKFWKISTLSTDPVTANQHSNPFTSPSILSVSLQARAGIVVSSDSCGVVKTWDISTGLCKASFQTPATRSKLLGKRDAKLVDGRLIFVWHEDEKIHIWDSGKGEVIQSLDTLDCRGLRISGDGSKVFCLHDGSIQAWPMWTWEPVGEVKLGPDRMPFLDSLCTDGSEVWARNHQLSTQEGWDFGVSGSSPVKFDPPTGRPLLDFIGGPPWQTKGLSWIKDTVTGKEVFRLRGEYANLMIYSGMVGT